ncbi:MAG: hypothetical protein K8R69_06435 [Deltaproteobacteria bacterium]|nr:hypothetical protein [Deltaproteobacteria bacterium]
MKKPAQLKLGLLILILPLFFFQLMQLVKFAPHGYPVLGIDFISRFEQRLTPVRQMLREEMAVGYLGEFPDDAVLARARLGDGQAAGEFFRLSETAR